MAKDAKRFCSHWFPCDRRIMKIIEYKTVFDCSASGIEKDVMELINEGWQPWGSLVFTISGSGSYNYVQAMVKYK